MSTQRINQVLWALSGALGAAAAVVLVLGLSPTPGGADSRAPTRPIAGPLTGPASGVELAELEPIWNLRLRRSFSAAAGTDVASAQPASATPGEGPLPLRLAGTIGESLALLRDPSGKVEVVAVGETLDGIEVLEIRPARVGVRFNGRVLTLEKLPELPDGL